MKYKSVCNLRVAGVVVFATAVGLLVGYRLGARRDDAVGYLKSGSIPSVDYFYSESSFSEVENTKATLEGLCRRFRTEIQQTRVADQLSSKSAPSRPTGPEGDLDQAIAALERGVQEFAGTTQQGDIAQDLLLTLKKSRQFDRWVEVYLTLLYAQPTHPGVTRFADEALKVGKLCGREGEIQAGLEHLRGIPLEFSGNQEVHTPLAVVAPEAPGK